MWSFDLDRVCFCPLCSDFVKKANYDLLLFDSKDLNLEQKVKQFVESRPKYETIISTITIDTRIERFLDLIVVFFNSFKEKYGDLYDFLSHIYRKDYLRKCFVNEIYVKNLKSMLLYSNLQFPQRQIIINALQEQNENYNLYKNVCDNDIVRFLNCHEVKSLNDIVQFLCREFKICIEFDRHGFNFFKQ